MFEPFQVRRAACKLLAGAYLYAGGWASKSSGVDVDIRRRQAKVAMLGSRAVLRVGGADARSWLQGLVTNDVEHIPAGEAASPRC